MFQQIGGRPSFPANPSLTSINTTTTVTSTAPLCVSARSPTQRDYAQAFGALQGQYGWGPTVSTANIQEPSPEERERRGREKRERKERKQGRKEKKELKRRGEQPQTTGDEQVKVGGSNDWEGVLGRLLSR